MWYNYNRLRKKDYRICLLKQTTASRLLLTMSCGDLPTVKNICVGALILKELFNMTDEEMVDSLVFDVLSQRFRKTWQFEFLSRVRNGVETVPSILRRRYHIDTMPVRGKIRTKHMLGFKIGALNFRKLLKYLSSREKCTLNPETV